MAERDGISGQVAPGHARVVRAEADDLEVTHPLHTLRRLIDAPLPLFAAGLY